MSVTMPHAKELEDILAAEQATILPIALKALAARGLGEAERLERDIAGRRPAEVADTEFIRDIDTKKLPQDSFNIYSAAKDLFRGSYWGAFSHIEEISGENKEIREQLGKIAIEQTFDPIKYNRGKAEGRDGEVRPNEYGSYTLLLEVIANPKSKLRHLVSAQDIEKCVNMAFVGFVKEPEFFVSRQHLWFNADEKTRKGLDWAYHGFCELLYRAQYLDKNLVLKTVEENQKFNPGWLSVLYLNYVFKRFKNETTAEEKAKLFWPVLKDIMWPRESFDVLAEEKKLLNKYMKHAKQPYCLQRAGKEFAEILTSGCEDIWQSVDFALAILGKQKLVQIIEETAMNAKGENADNLVKLATTKGDIASYVNLATVQTLKSYCKPNDADDKYDLDSKAGYMKALSKIETSLKTVPG
jgi:hypothetical protein